MNSTHPYLYAILTPEGQHFTRLGFYAKDPQNIIKAVAKALKLRERLLIGDGGRAYKRNTEISDARTIATGIIVQAFPKLKVVEIGRIFGRDHSSISCAKKKFNELSMHDKIFKSKLNKVYEKLDRQ